MNPKTTAVLFAIAAALAAFVYFYEIEGEEARVEAKAAEKRVFPDVDQGAITAISLRVSGASQIRLERREGHWRIVAPIDAAADAFAADGLASALTQLMRESEIEDPRSADVYGLGADGAEVRFRVGDLEKTLRIGSGTPVGANSYAAVEGDDRVFTVASYQLGSFKKSLADFRDKRILDFDPATVRRVTASWPEARVVVERSDAGWQMLEPVGSPADGDAIDDLLTSLSFLRAAEFVDEPATDAEMGFAPPQFAVELERSGETEGSELAALRVAFGGVDETASQRFVRGAGDSLYLISGQTFDRFPRKVVEYRDRRLAAFTTDDVRRVEIGFHTSAGETVAVTLTREGDVWTSNADAVLPERLDALLDVLSDLRAEDIIAEALGPEELQAMGLDPARAVLQIYGDGDPPNRLAEVQLGVAFGGGITARTPDRDAIFLLDAELELPTDFAAYRAHFVAPPEPLVDVSDATVDASGANFGEGTATAPESIFGAPEATAEAVEGDGT